MYGMAEFHISFLDPFSQSQICSLDRLSSLTALLTALSDLDSLCETVGERYVESLTKDSYERWEEKS
jgi:DNA-directed RNA polymerase I and III subunit RPAC2